MKKLRIPIVSWLFISFINFGAINASEKANPWYCDGAAFGSSARQQYAEQMIWALMPVAGSAIAILGTGFFEHGFDWTWTCPHGEQK